MNETPADPIDDRWNVRAVCRTELGTAVIGLLLVSVVSNALMLIDVDDREPRGLLEVVRAHGAVEGVGKMRADAIYTAFRTTE